MENSIFNSHFFLFKESKYFTLLKLSLSLSLTFSHFPSHFPSFLLLPSRFSLKRRLTHERSSKHESGFTAADRRMNGWSAPPSHTFTSEELLRPSERSADPPPIEYVPMIRIHDHLQDLHTLRILVNYPPSGGTITFVHSYGNPVGIG